MSVDSVIVKGYEEINKVSLGVNLLPLNSENVEVVSTSYEGLIVVSPEDVESSPEIDRSILNGLCHPRPLPQS